jgi:hypothetical protein
MLLAFLLYRFWLAVVGWKVFGANFSFLAGLLSVNWFFRGFYRHPASDGMERR